jgi:tRNA A-37 threonylcarbamoyl transferase component Bud32
MESRNNMNLNLEDLLGAQINIDKNGMKVIRLSDVKLPYLNNNSVYVKRLEPTYFAGDLVYGEFRNLCRIHDIAPDYTVAPYALIVDKQGHYVGYLMEAVAGEDLEIDKRKLMLPGEAREVRSQIVSAMGLLHSKGIGHGDLDYSNIVKYKKDGQAYIKLIDPAPSLRRKDDERNIREDKKWLKSMMSDYWEDRDVRFTSQWKQAKNF